MIKNAIVFIFFLVFGINTLYSQNNKDSFNFIVNSELSSVEWFCGRHFGCVMLDTGYIDVVDGVISGGKFVIDLNSLYDDDIENELLRQTLSNVIKSFEFFDISHYPSTTFTIEKLIGLSDNEFNVSGNLTLKGKTLPINFNAEIDIAEDTVKVYSDYISIDRTMWGINYLSKKFDPEDKEQMHVPDKIEFLVRLLAVRAKGKKKKK